MDTVHTTTPVGKTAVFTGYRMSKMPFAEQASDPLYRQFRDSLAVTLLMLLSRGYTRFVTGMAEGFDTMVAEDVLLLKEKYPEKNLVLHCAVPFPGQADAWPDAAKIRRQAILDRADEVCAVSPVYRTDCYHIRNRYMVDMADVVIAAYDGMRGGTQYTVRYAQSKGVRVICIDPTTGNRSVYRE